METPKIRIRRGTKEDVDLLLGDGVDEGEGNLIVVYPSDRVSVFVLEEDGKPVAIGSSVYSKSSVMLKNLYCLPEYRGKGYACKLVECRLRDARNRGLTKARAITLRPSEGIYRKYGFREGKRYSFSVYMSKDLG